MRVGIHQPEYLGYMGFYNKMLNSDAWVFLDNVQLAKRDFMRRNRIRGPHGAMWLSVPVITKGRYYQAIKDVEIDNTQGWRDSHWKSMEYNYKRAPFFAQVAPDIKSIYERDWQRLADLNIAIIRTMARLLGVERPMYVASELGIDGKSSQLLADLTRAVGGDVYLSGPMGRDYLENHYFDDHGLKVEYNDFSHPTYAQGKDAFVPYLAAIDVLFHHGPAARDLIASGTANGKVEMTDEMKELEGAS